MNPVDSHILTSVEITSEGSIGRLTLYRPKALNALSLAMIRDISKTLVAWRDDPAISLVLLRGTKWNKASEASESFGAFCAGGDIRYFYEAVYSKPDDELNRDSLEAFFTEEYALNHLIHHYPKPVIAFMDGVVMGGGMGLTQGASIRIVTERTKMAMPETAIGLFPDVGGGYFLSRCANGVVGVGEYLALTGQMLSGVEAVSMGLADVLVESKDLSLIWNDPLPFSPPKQPKQTIANVDLMQKHFAFASLQEIVQSLQADDSAWAKTALTHLQKNSPLMLAVTLEQVRRARQMSLAADLRMERDMVYHCFAGAPVRYSDTVEGIRALVINKDHSPKWQPARIEDVTPEMVSAFFDSPWLKESHPLQKISG
jgi:enoyl-CoA hydratase